jgi:hypothetical protein
MFRHHPTFDSIQYRINLRHGLIRDDLLEQYQVDITGMDWRAAERTILKVPSKFKDGPAFRRLHFCGPNLPPEAPQNGGYTTESATDRIFVNLDAAHKVTETWVT